MSKLRIDHESDDEFSLGRSAISEMRKAVFKSWMATKPDSDERAYYIKLVNAYDKLLSKYEAVLVSDKSQDAEPEEDDEEE